MRIITDIVIEDNKDPTNIGWGYHLSEGIFDEDDSVLLTWTILDDGTPRLSLSKQPSGTVLLQVLVPPEVFDPSRLKLVHRLVK